MIATMSYDGKGRQIQKAIANNADQDCTYVFYHDDDSTIETRNGSGYLRKQQVWGSLVAGLSYLCTKMSHSSAKPQAAAGLYRGAAVLFRAWAICPSNPSAIPLLRSSGRGVLCPAG